MVHYSRLWIVIADGEHARFVGREPRGRTLHTVKIFTSRSAGERSSDLVSDRPGRTFESMGTTRHAIQPKHDPHLMAKEAFVESVAEQVNAAAAAGEFDHLVLVAPDRALTTLHEALSAETRKCVVGTLGKDLTKVPDHDLGEHVREWL
jgi:protein required for attachment to host cells